MSEGFEEKVERWLRTLGCTPVRITDERANWHFEIDYPRGTPHRIHVINPREQSQAVVIATGVTVSADHLKAFEELDDDAKLDFQWDLRKTLNQDFAEFNIVGMDDAKSCPKAFEITATRFEDGLSLDSFARSISSVYKTELAGIMCIQQHLGGRGYGASGRFDFRRLGI